MLGSSPDRQFAQLKPPHVCREWQHFLAESAKKGHKVSCRTPRCSLACYAAWRQKQGSILARFLRHHLPAGMSVFRGNLHMPEGATVADHRYTKTRFLRLLKAHKEYTIRIEATAHVHKLDAQHYDFILYSDGPLKMTRKIVKHEWESARGDRSTLRPIDQDDDAELIGSARYAVKDTPKKNKRQFIYLPASNGLEIQFTSASFYANTSKIQLWDDCRRSWFGTPQDQDEQDTSNYDNVTYDRNDPSKLASELARVNRFQGLGRDIHKFAMSAVRSNLPDDPTEGIHIFDLSRRVSIPERWLYDLLRSLPGVEFNSACRYWAGPSTLTATPLPSPYPSARRGTHGRPPRRPRPGRPTPRPASPPTQTRTTATRTTDPDRTPPDRVGREDTAPTGPVRRRQADPRSPASTRGRRIGGVKA